MSLLICATLLLIPTNRSSSDQLASPIRLRASAEHGLASYYGRGFHGRRTASGIRFDSNTLVAAHPRYPFGTLLRVTNLNNGRSVRVRVVDRGPARGPRRAGVIIDVSRAAAEALKFVREGRTRVRVERITASPLRRSRPTR